MTCSVFILSFNLSKTTRRPPPPPVCQGDPVEVDYSKYLAGVDTETSRAANITSNFTLRTWLRWPGDGTDVTVYSYVGTQWWCVCADSVSAGRAEQVGRERPDDIQTSARHSTRLTVDSPVVSPLRKYVE